ncbi:C50 family peptidase [bacterium]|nr:C50 family peptidase [bacterium]
MKLSSETTIISQEKLRDYILNPSNPDGRSKARFLEEIGYQQKDWQGLEADLRVQHLSTAASTGRSSEYGKKYEIVAPLTGPNGQTRWFRSIWMIRKGESVARFITLIPERRP